MHVIPVNTPDVTAADRDAVLECLKAGWISSEGPQVARFENLFAPTFGRKHGIAVSSGRGSNDAGEGSGLD